MFRKILLSIFVGLTLGFAIDFCFNGPMVFAERYVQPTWNSGLVGYWSFDGKYTTSATTTDQSGNGNTGTLVTTTKVAGISGQALSFNGTTSYVNAGSGTSLDTAGAITVEAWIKPEHKSTSDNSIVKKYGGSNGWSLYYDSSDYLYVYFTTASSSWSVIYFNHFMNVNAWQHVVWTYDGVNTTNLYLNGSLDKTTGSKTGSLLSAAGYNLHISGDSLFKGSIDEVRIYSRALSADEVKSHYALTARKFRAASQNPAQWSNGLVGYWSFDGKYTTAATTTDQSGNGNTGTLYGPKAVAGISGQALNFNGTGDYATVLSYSNFNLKTNFTAETWMYSSGNTGWDVWFTTGQYVIEKINTTQCWVALGKSGSWQGAITSTNGSCPENKWIHIVFTYSSPDAKLYINGILNGTSSLAGPLDDAMYFALSSPGQDAKGIMDEFRIYNRALAAEEVLQHYALTKRKFVVDTPNPATASSTTWTSGLVGYWSFDGKYTTAATTTDQSGNNNTGTLGGGTAAYKPVPVAGISGQALSFDGTNDYINVGDGASLKGMSNLTIEAWIKGNSFNEYSAIVDKWSWNYQQHYLFGYFRNGSATKLGTFQLSVSQQLTVGNSQGLISQTNLDLNRWYHVVGVFKGGEYLKIYINGVEDNSTTTSVGYIATGSYNTSIGLYGSYYFPGSIDEVRIYNRALSPAEVLQHYQQTKRNLKM